MKKLSKLLALALTFVMTVAMAMPAVANADTASAGTVKPQIVGKTSTVTLARGDKLAVFKAPVNLKAGTVTYTSSNPKVVKLTKSGSTTYATAAANGTAVITAKSSVAGVAGGTLTVKVVTGQKATAVNFTSNDTTLYVGQAVKTKITTTPNAASKKMAYTSSNPDVATVSSNGMIRGISGGTATITATTTDGTNLSSSVDITVTSVKWNGTNKIMYEGDTADAASYFTFLPASVANSAKYVSSDPSILSVDGSTLTAVKAGKVTLTVKANDRSGVSKDYTFSVRAKEAEEVELQSVTAEDITVRMGNQAQINAVVNPEDAKAELSYEVVAGTSYIDVDANGVVTAKARGTATVEITAKNSKSEVTTTISVKVTQDVTKATFRSDFADGSPIEATFNGFKWTDASDFVTSLNELITKLYGNLGNSITCAFVKDGAEYTIELSGAGVVLKDQNGQEVDLEALAAQGSVEGGDIKVSVPGAMLPKLLEYIEAAQGLGTLEYNGVVMSSVKFLACDFKFGSISQVTVMDRETGASDTYKFFVENGELYFEGNVTETSLMKDVFNNANSDKRVFESLTYPVYL